MKKLLLVFLVSCGIFTSSVEPDGKAILDTAADAVRCREIAHAVDASKPERQAVFDECAKDAGYDP